ncbi:MAG: type II toxin-antitoxin system VapC family toxin [Deltaproteobacteria bacterium]|nr:type II toxin-antitoxin system VapC family toxin [Deltaproteobacteria bacterium]
MNVYSDSSVLLRIVLGEPSSLSSWRKVTRAFTSELCRVECHRTIDRLRLDGRLNDLDVAERREAIEEQLRGHELIAVDRRILRRASEPMPTRLGTLDAIHVASALALKTKVATLRLATHDEEMAVAARALGFRLVT